jgi:hypothetical protein
MGLPAATFGLAALPELDVQQTRPKPPRALGIISRKLDQAERSAHATDDNVGAAPVAIRALARSGASKRR